MPETCPGCGGRGTVVSLNTVMACGRCHGQGTIDPLAEAIERRRADKEMEARTQANIREYTDLLEKLRDGD